MIKKLFFAIIVLTLMVSCASENRCARRYPCNPVTNTETKVVDRIVPIPAVQDSGSLKALFSCDSNNKVILKDYNQLWSKYFSAVTALEPDSSGNMSIKLKVATNHPATNVKVRDSIVYREKEIKVPAPYPVEKELSWFQKTLIYTGALLWIAALIYILILIFKKSIKSLLP